LFKLKFVYQVIYLRTFFDTYNMCYLYRTLAGVPGVAQDEKLRKQIFEITWRDKGWIG